MHQAHLAVLLIPALLALPTQSGEGPQVAHSPADAGRAPGADRASGSGSSLETGGTIAGTVTVSGSGSPVQNLAVEVHDGNGTYLTFYTDSAGGYSAGGLQPGSYYLRTRSTEGHVDELYDDIYCPAVCSVTAGTPVAVAAGATTSGIDFALDVGGRVAGAVTATGSGDPLQDVGVILIASNGVFASYGITDASGSYTTHGGLPPETYRARTSNDFGYVDELYDDVPCPGGGCSSTSAVLLSVTAGTTITGVDFALDPGGRVAGTVTARGSGDPIPNVFVGVFDSSGFPVASGFTDSAGSYLTSSAVPPGSYYARTTNFDAYFDELYDDIPCEPGCAVTSGTPIWLVAGGITTGIDFTLQVPLSFWRADARTTAPPGPMGIPPPKE